MIIRDIDPLLAKDESLLQVCTSQQLLDTFSWLQVILYHIFFLVFGVCRIQIPNVIHLRVPNMNVNGANRNKTADEECGRNLRRNLTKTQTETQPERLVISEFARKQLEKHGYRKGDGLGNRGQGMTVPVQCTTRLQGDRSGLGSIGTCEYDNVDKRAWREVKAADLRWIERSELLLDSSISFQPQHEWLVKGQNLKEYKYSNFCPDSVLEEVLENRGITNMKSSTTIKKFFPCYLSQCTPFVSRAGVKLADVFDICSQSLMKDGAMPMTGTRNRDRV